MSPARIFLALIILLLMGLPGLVTAQQYFSDNLDETVMNRALLDNMRHDPFIIYDSTELIAYIEANMATHHIPGIAVCVVKDSQIVWTRCFGYADLENSIPVADTTIFLLASISKTFIANATMQMWENGYLDLDADINNYIPFDVVNPYFPDSAITMRTILSHVSSIDRRDWTWEPDMVWGHDHPTPVSQYLEDYLVNGGPNYSPYNYLMSPPGYEFEYSNYALALAGYIIEQMAINNGIADSLEQYCRDSLWEPLGMEEISWFLSDLDTSNIAVQYAYSGGYIRYGFCGLPIYPAGQLRTTSVNLARHLMAFSMHGELNGVRILESETVDTMMTVQYPDTPSDDPAGMAFGIGWRKHFDVGNDWELWGHSGGTLGCKTMMFFNPADGTGFVELTNSAGDGTGATNIAYALAGFAKDPDMDNIIAGFDNCPYDYNPDQLDTDEDGVGDICDNCPEVANEDQENPDGDNFGSACDNCPDIVNNYQLNSDNDSYGNACDNCPNVDNEDQADSDEDGIGDACEYVCGDVNGTQTVNILDITYLIAYLYKEGPAPNCG